MDEVLSQALAVPDVSQILHHGDHPIEGIYEGRPTRPDPDVAHPAGVN